VVAHDLVVLEHRLQVAGDVLRPFSAAMSVSAWQKTKSQINGGGGSASWNSRYSERQRSMLGSRDFHDRSANMTIAAFRRAAASTESSELATAYRRSAKLRDGRTDRRAWLRVVRSRPSMNPVSSACLTIIEPSSKRSRDSPCRSDRRNSRP